MISIEPVRKQLRVRASQSLAFAMFTEHMSRWWPPTHSLLKSPLKQCIIEPHVGGRWYTVGEDGSTCETGYVIDWQPPRSLSLAWQINGVWQYDPALITEVEVRFIAESADTTRIELEHRHLERMRDTAVAARSAIDSPGGWSGILETFRTFAEK